MSDKRTKHALEKKRRRLRSQGWDLDIIDAARLQKLRLSRVNAKKDSEPKK